MRSCARFSASAALASCSCRAKASCSCLYHDSHRQKVANPLQEAFIAVYLRYSACVKFAIACAIHDPLGSDQHALHLHYRACAGQEGMRPSLGEGSDRTLTIWRRWACSSRSLHMRSFRRSFRSSRLLVRPSLRPSAIRFASAACCSLSALCNASSLRQSGCRFL